MKYLRISFGIFNSQVLCFLRCNQILLFLPQGPHPTFRISSLLVLDEIPHCGVQLDGCPSRGWTPRHVCTRDLEVHHVCITDLLRSRRPSVISPVHSHVKFLLSMFSKHFMWLVNKFTENLLHISVSICELVPGQ